MSTKTEQLGLYKYDPVADAAKTFSISTALNDNWDKIDADSKSKAAALKGAVKFDAAQSLSDAQKTQARANINAAPGGFGLGGGAKFLTAENNLNYIWEAGWYAWDAAPENAPIYNGSPFMYCTAIVLNKGGAYMIHQIVYSTTGAELHRTNNGLEWSDWEWANPPMELGVEYRTMERYLGKPVYVKAVSFGTLPANSKKAVAHGIDNLAQVLAYSGAVGYWAWPTVPNVIDIQFTPTNIEITTDADLSGYETSMILKYSKSTD